MLCLRLRFGGRFWCNLGFASRRLLFHLQTVHHFPKRATKLLECQFSRRHSRNFTVSVYHGPLKSSVDSYIAVPQKSFRRHSSDRVTSNCVLVALTYPQNQLNPSLRVRQFFCQLYSNHGPNRKAIKFYFGAYAQAGHFGNIDEQLILWSECTRGPQIGRDPNKDTSGQKNRHDS